MPYLMVDKHLHQMVQCAIMLAPYAYSGYDNKAIIYTTKRNHGKETGP